MLNVLWPGFIIISFVYAILTGNVNEVNNGIFNSCKEAVELTITFFGTMCLWNGIIEIAKQSSIMDRLTTAINPIMHFIFPDINRKDKAYKEISMNIIANILGLGNAATPLGLKAMKSLQEKNEQKDTVSNSMAMFIVLNTASIQLIPTTVIAIRNSLGSEDSTKIIVPVWIVTIVAAMVGISLTKVLSKNKKGEKRNANH